MRKLAVLAILLCFAALLWTLLPGPEEPVAPEAPPPDAPPPVEEPPAPVPEKPPVPHAEHATTPDSPRGWEPEELKGPKVTVTGTVVVLEVDGTERDALDGSLSYTVWRDRTGWSRKVPVVKGGFSIEAPEGSRLKFKGIEFGDRGVVLSRESREKFPAAPNRPIALRGTWFTATRLQVLAADTGSPLREVLVVYGSGGNSAVHPADRADHGQRFASGNSPIDLPRPKYHDAGNTTTYRVKAPGYAWGRIEVDPTAGGERTIRLAQAGGLLVRILATDLDEGARLRIESVFEGSRSPFAQGESQFETVVGSRTEIEVDSLPVGTVRVFLELGDRSNSRILLAEARAKVVAGQREEVLLEPKELEPVDRVPMAGEIVLPPEWGVARVRMKFELLDAARDGQAKQFTLSGDQVTPVPGRKGVFRFDAGKAQPGRYELSIRETGWVTSLRLPDQGATDLRIVVPPPVAVSVRVIDEDTGSDADVEKVHWHIKWPEWVSGGILHSAGRNPQTKRFEFRAPHGHVVIDVDSDDHDGPGKTVELRDGVNQVELRVRTACGVMLRLKDGETPVAWIWDWRVQLRQIDGDGSGRQFSIPDGVHRISVTGPGTYRVIFPKIEGYRAIPNREVTVRPGEFAGVTVELERED